MSILVCPLSQLSETVARLKGGRVISVLDPDHPFPELGPLYVERHLRLAFHDAHSPSPGITVPSADQIAHLLAFLDAWDAGEHLVVHCRAGIGRSTATAYVAACYRNPQACELQIAAALRLAAPLARPNQTLVDIADSLMGRRGRMSTSIAESGRGLPWVDVREGQPFELPSHFEARAQP